MKYTQVHISRAHWDSNNFNLNIGNIFIANPEELTLTNLVDFVKQGIVNGEKEQYQLLYLQLPSNLKLPTLSLNNKKVLFADIKVVYEKQLKKKERYIHDKHVASYNSSEINEALLNLAFESGKHSRFKRDPNFPPGTFEKMYSIWISKSVKKEIADNVIVYQIQNKIAGMLTYSIQQKSALIGLIAVDKSHQGENIGSILLSSLEEIINRKGIDTIEVATQRENTAACNFYLKNQFNIKKEINIYHIWL